MFLAFKEIKYSKSKFALIISVILLVSYLVYFLTGLAYGLASSYSNVITKWEANEIVLTVDSNDSIMMSFVTESMFNDIEVDGTKEKVGVFPAVANNPLSDDILSTRLNVYFFGINNDSSLKPSELSNIELVGNKVIADIELEKEGFRVGDLIGISGSEEKFEIMAFSTKTTYQITPVIYMSLDTWQKFRFETQNPPNLASGIVIKGNVISKPDSLEVYTIDEFINTLPGYTAQVLTFSVMIVFLIIIVAFVLGIFIYVLTIQKTSMFGVMKAQGISNFYIASSVIVQTFLLVAFGIVVGLGLTLVSGYFLADVLPFSINILFFVVISIAFFVFALFGALFSVNAVLKIDPLRAIGG